jgi:hypothetical protein
MVQKIRRWGAVLDALRRGKVMLLALIVALTLGVASTAMGHTGSVGLFHLNHSNAVNATSKLVGSVAGPILRLDNSNASGTALNLQVEPNRPPMTVNSSTKVTDLNADQLDGQDSTAFLPNATYTKEDSGTGFDIGGPRLLETFCDSGDVIVSGGHFGMDQGTTLAASGPEDFHQGWQVQWINDGTLDTITVIALCADFGTPHTP